MEKIDPLFKKYFGIETSIVYLTDVKVQKKIEKSFKRSWSRFYPRALPIISDYRIDRFDAFFRQLERDGTDERYTRRVAIRFINKVVGYGVFAKEDIPPYSTLTHYAGILMLDKEINVNHDSTFSFSDYKAFSIDGAKQGNWARFMNHCPEKERGNNVIPWEHYIEKGPRIVFTAGAHGIKRGRQLLYSYGDEYWKDKQDKSLKL